MFTAYLIALLVALVWVFTGLWAVPTQTAKQTPPGIQLTDGFPTTISFALLPGVNLWEVNVKPPGWDGGEAIDISTMHNVAYMTYAPRQLKKLTPISSNCAYDPNVLKQVTDSLINKPGSITIWFPDNSAVSFFGYLQKFEPTDMKEGEHPVAACIIIPTNYDPVNNVEAGPLYAFAEGT